MSYILLQREYIIALLYTIPLINLVCLRNFFVQDDFNAFVVHSDSPGNKWLVNLDFGLHTEIKVLTVEFPDQIWSDSHYRLFVLKIFIHHIC